MSGRSAYVRKKITQTKDGERGPGLRSRAKSSASSDNATISEHPIDPIPSLRHGERERQRDITGVGTTNARFLKFSEPARESEMLSYQSDMAGYGNQSGGSQSGGSSIDGRREGGGSGGAGPSHFNRPLDDFAYARARRPAIKTEDVSGIEKSGFRSILDKKSDEVRKGLAKTFAFRKKDRKVLEVEKMADFRPQSAATVRPHQQGAGYSPGDLHDGYEADDSPVQFAGSSANPWEDDLAMSPPPSSKLPPVPSAGTAPPIKRWIGAGRPVQRWNKLRKDPELWDPNGDVLVFFGHKGQQPRPNPSFRLSSHIIEATESRYLITLLREGSTEEDIHLPPSPVGAPPMLQRHPGGQHLHPQGGGYGGRGGQPTPPVSEDNSLWEQDGQISYEMYFPTPSNMTKLDQMRHHITTRNVFALLYHASLVGLSLYQALADLHSRLESYMPPEADNVGTILNYLSARGIDDVRNDPEAAVSILAWSEGPEVRWEEGWRESFLHCAGMYGQLESCADFKNVTPITRALLERACLETQLRVQAAGERLAAFQYADMWPTGEAAAVATAPARSAAERLQNFFVQHYSQEFGRWPPLPMPSGHEQASIGMAHGGGPGGDEDMWLTRAVAQTLQRDFAALYDYLVNRDVVWDESEARSSRKWMMVSESGNRGFEADTDDLPLTDMLIGFDNRLRFPHIPHPYPLVPESIPPPSAAASSRSGPANGGMFGSKLSNKKLGGNNSSTNLAAAPSTSRPGAVERRIQLAYTEATNICILGSEFTHSDLIDAFGKFEKADRISEVDPSTARRGRWVLIYGILQTLASVSVDAPNVRYRDDVPYHLSPRLKGAKMPPWKPGPSHGNANPEEASHELSHCWIVPRTWDVGGSGTGSAVNSGAESSAEEGTSPTSRAYHFPMPRGRSGAAGRSAAGQSGYYAPGGMAARSVRSVASSRAPSALGGPPYSGGMSFSSAGSATSTYSVSDAGGSARSPTSTAASSRRAGRSTRDRERAKIAANMMLRGIEQVDENERQAPGQTYAASTSSGARSDYKPAPLTNAAVSQQGAFLVLDELADDTRSFTAAYASSGRDKAARGSVRGGTGSAGAAGSGPSGHGSGYKLERLGFESRSAGDTRGVGPMIRDFDELSVADSHAP